MAMPSSMMKHFSSIKDLKHRVAEENEALKDLADRAIKMVEERERMLKEVIQTADSQSKLIDHFTQEREEILTNLRDSIETKESLFHKVRSFTEENLEKNEALLRLERKLSELESMRKPEKAQNLSNGEKEPKKKKKIKKKAMTMKASVGGAKKENKNEKARGWRY